LGYIAKIIQAQMLAKSMTYRPKRRIKRFILKTQNKEWVAITAKPWIYVGNTCVWLVVLGVSKSRRQLSDWLHSRNTKRSRKLKHTMSGHSGTKPLTWAFTRLKDFQEHIPWYDGLWFWFDAVEKDKQRRVYLKWFEKKGMNNWQYIVSADSFYYFKDPAVEYKKLLESHGPL
jgi:hypothetical protein